MIVSVSSENGTLAWERRRRSGEPPSGFNDPSYFRDGRHSKIVDALQEALDQAKAQLSSACFQVRNIIPDIGATTTKIYDDVPVVGVRNNDSRRQHPIEATIITMRPTVPIGTKVRVVHDKDVALVVALNNNRVTTF
jgi:hypothetical protein